MNIEEHIQGIKTRKGLVQEFTRLHRRIAALESRKAEVGSNKPEIGTNIQEKASTIPDILYQLDEEGRIVFISKAIEAYGYTLDELIGRFMFELIHPTDRKKAKYCINERRSGERRTEALELRLLTKIRKVVPVEFRIGAVEEFCVATVLIDAEGIYSSTPTAASVFLYTQGRAKDISERKVWEEEQQRQDDDLERRVADRTADLQAANFQLYCKIAHDKKAITEAQESEAWHRRLVELSPVAVLLFRAGEIVYANTLAAELLGAATPDLLEGRLLRDFQIGREPTGGRNAVMESCFVRMDGQEIDVEIRAVPFVFQEQPAVLAVVQDITLAKRKSRQQMARQDLYEIAAHMQGPADNDKLLMAICECLNAAAIPYLFCGIYIVNKNAGQPQIKQQFKYRLADSQMVQVAPLGADQATLVLRFWQAGIPLYRPDLEKEDLYCEKVAIMNIIGMPVQAMLDLPFAHAVLRVGTSLPEAFEAIHITTMQEIVMEAQTGLQRGGSVSSSSEALPLAEAQKMEAIEQLAAGIAHNFNNMLQGIMGNLDLVQREILPRGEEWLKDAEKGVSRAAEMVQQLMIFARVGKREIYSSVNVGVLLEDTIDICRQTINENVDIDILITDDLLPVMGDMGSLRKAFLNLLSNATEALEEAKTAKPQLRIRVEMLSIDDNIKIQHVVLDSGDYVRFSIGDNGIGMDDTVRERIFEPFFTTKSIDKGTGLGLSTVHGIIQQHAGAIECQSRLGLGTEFIVYLPVYKGNNGNSIDLLDAYDDAPSGESMVGMSAWSTEETLLLIDDEQTVRESIAQILVEEGYEVITAVDGLEGLRCYAEAEERPSLVILDLSRPGMSNIEVLKKMQIMEPDVKVVIINEKDTGAAFIPAVATIIQKPLKTDELIHIVRQALE